jgi:hypothetical protein
MCTLLKALYSWSLALLANLSHHIFTSNQEPRLAVLSILMCTGAEGLYGWGLLADGVREQQCCGGHVDASAGEWRHEEGVRSDQD